MRALLQTETGSADEATFSSLWFSPIKSGRFMNRRNNAPPATSMANSLPLTSCKVADQAARFRNARLQFVAGDDGRRDVHADARTGLHQDKVLKSADSVESLVRHLITVSRAGEVRLIYPLLFSAFAVVEDRRPVPIDSLIGADYAARLCNPWLSAVERRAALEKAYATRAMGSA